MKVHCGEVGEAAPVAVDMTWAYLIEQLQEPTHGAGLASLPKSQATVGHQVLLQGSHAV